MVRTKLVLLRADSLSPAFACVFDKKVNKCGGAVNETSVYKSKLMVGGLGGTRTLVTGIDG